MKTKTKERINGVMEYWPFDSAQGPNVEVGGRAVNDCCYEVTTEMEVSSLLNCSTNPPQPQSQMLGGIAVNGCC